MSDNNAPTPNQTLEAELDAMDAPAESAAPVAGKATEAEVDPALVPHRKAPDIDQLLEEAAAATARAKERERVATEKEKTANALHEKYKAIHEAKEKGDIKAFVRLARADGWTKEQIIEELAYDDDFPAATDDKGEAEGEAKPEDLDALLDKKLEDREQKKADAKKQAHAAELEDLRQKFHAASVASFKANKDKYPTTRAWAKKVTPDLIRQTFREVILANPDAPPPTPENIWEHIEAKFNAEIEMARPLIDRARSQANNMNDVYAEIDAIDRGEAPPKPTGVIRKDPTKVASSGPPPPKGRTALDEIYAEIDAMDREHNGRIRYSS